MTTIAHLFRHERHTCHSAPVNARLYLTASRLHDCFGQIRAACLPTDDPVGTTQRTASRTASEKSAMKYGFVVITLALLTLTTPAMSQTMVPATNGACPSGASYAGSGYCRSTNRNFVPANNGSCPSGSSYAGAGYCGSPSTITFVPARNGSCPSGASYAGSGYCKVK